MREISRLGIIGGGQMGEALIRGMIEAGVLAADKMMIAEPDQARREYMQRTYGAHATIDAAELCSFAPVVIVAVKPQIMSKVLSAYHDHLTSKHLIISIAAGVTIQALERDLPADIAVIRVMPNTPALVLAGASALSPNAHATRDDMDAALRIFNAVGEAVEVPESMLDAVTGLSGSGPGYVFTFIESMIDGGVLAGLPRPIAEKLVLQTVYGSAKLAMETGEPPAVLKGRVTSPGGTTIAGLRVLEETGMRGAVMNAVDAAAQRSRDLGK